MLAQKCKNIIILLELAFYRILNTGSQARLQKGIAWSDWVLSHSALPDLPGIVGTMGCDRSPLSWHIANGWESFYR